MKPAWVYILRCSDGSYYTGATTDLERRISEHRAGRASKYTRSRRPIELMYSAEQESLAQAYQVELRIKRLPRSKKEDLILNGS